ncbi:MAG: hypothetical protein KJ067_18890 [Vicinamibacteria bacterium]|nr:hypothetical protein [Vicinamibacteria bacterium]
MTTQILLGTEEFFALYRGIAEHSRDPAIGLRIGAEVSSHRLPGKRHSRLLDDAGPTRGLDPAARA